MRFDRRAAILIVAAIIAGCVPQQPLPATCNDPAVTLTATLADEHLDPGVLEACRGQQVTLSVKIERDGIFHLHGYDDQSSATEVRGRADAEPRVPGGAQRPVPDRAAYHRWAGRGHRRDPHRL
jgi:hypothetical protein